RRPVERRPLQPDSEQRGTRPGNEGHCGGRRRRRGGAWRGRSVHRHAPRRAAARQHPGGTRLFPHPAPLGARGPWRAPARRGRRGCLALTAAVHGSASRCGGDRMTRRFDVILGGAILVEIAAFGGVAPRFLSVANAFEIIRASVELGLLAVALTPILVSGGIDLSV